MFLFGVVEGLQLLLVESLVLVLAVHGVVLDLLSAVFDCLHHSSLGGLVGVEFGEGWRVQDLQKIIFDLEVVGHLCHLLLHDVLVVLQLDLVKMVLGIGSEVSAPQDNGLIRRVDSVDTRESLDGFMHDIVRQLFGVDSSQLELQLGDIEQVKFHIDMIGGELVAEESNKALQCIDEDLGSLLFKDQVDLLEHFSVDLRGLLVKSFPLIVAGVFFDIHLEFLLFRANLVEFFGLCLQLFVDL